MRLSIEGLWKYRDAVEGALADIGELEDTVEYYRTMMNEVNAELESKQQGINFMTERIAILEKQVQELMRENERLKTGKGIMVFDPDSARWVPSYCTYEHLVARSGVPVRVVQRDKSDD